MTTAPLPEPVPRSSGCFAKACLTFVCLFLLLAVAFIGGGYWAFRHLQNTYSATTPLTFGNVTSSEPAVPQTFNDEIVDRIDESLAEGPQTQPSEAAVPIEPVRARWRAFEKAAKHDQQAHIELTADDINSLIASDPKLRGKAFVTIANNSARVKVSVPLDDVFMMKGRYLNGEASVEPAPDGDPRHAQISNVVLANQNVPDTMLDTRLFGWSSIRGYMTDWLDDNNVAYFTIQDGRVVGDTRGTR